jgi:hypothetical protein
MVSKEVCPTTNHNGEGPLDRIWSNTNNFYQIRQLISRCSIHQTSISSSHGPAIANVYSTIASQVALTMYLNICYSTSAFCLVRSAACLFSEAASSSHILDRADKLLGLDYLIPAVLPLVRRGGHEKDQLLRRDCTIHIPQGQLVVRYPVPSWSWAIWIRQVCFSERDDKASSRDQMDFIG